MEERKHIDRLYQEKFKDFEAAPREAVWNNISSKLQEKKRKKSAFPLWYRLAGVAAVLALLFNYASGLFKTSSSITNTSSVTTTEQQRNFGDLTLVSNTYNENMLRSSIILQALILDTADKQEREAFEASRNSSSTGKAGLNSPVSRSQRQNSLTQTYFKPITSSFPVLSALSYQEMNMEKEMEETPLNKDIPLPTLKKTSLTEEAEEKPAPDKRLRVSTVAAPVYFDNLGDGSAIDARFANNNSGGEISMAYGINFAYKISDKIKIRSGISKVDLSYNTKDIAFTATVNPSALSGIDYRGEIPKYRIENTTSRPFGNITASSEFNRSSLASPAAGYLNQKLGFIEVPVELEFAIIDKRVGLNLIGGGSTLFLDQNMISLNSSNFSTDLGAANNLNSVSFSTNVGVGVDYEITPQFQLNLEPIFKYQINTYNDNNDLNPYYFGIYTGFSFKF